MFDGIGTSQARVGEEVAVLAEWVDAGENALSLEKVEAGTSNVPREQNVFEELTDKLV